MDKMFFSYSSFSQTDISLIKGTGSSFQLDHCDFSNQGYQPRIIEEAKDVEYHEFRWVKLSNLITLYIVNCTFGPTNVNATDGGAINVEIVGTGDSNPFIIHNNFSDFVAQRGGAIFILFGNHRVSIVSNTFKNIVATESGGGTYMDFHESVTFH